MSQLVVHCLEKKCHGDGIPRMSTLWSEALQSKGVEIVQSGSPALCRFG